MASQKSDNRHVNHLLHTLRGEQFRHAQNVRKSKSHISSSFVRNKPTLPIDLASLDYGTVFSKSSSEESSGTLRDNRASSPSPSSSPNPSSSSRCSRPAAPKSWTLITPKQDRYETASWRSTALSQLYSQLEEGRTRTTILSEATGPPPLTMLCLEYLMARCTLTELKEEILPYIPSHLRAVWVRYTAVHAPLPNQRLFALYEEEGHADGEIFVVGPNNSLRDDFFLQASPTKGDEESRGEGSARHDAMDDDWDSEERSPTLLRTVAILSTRLSMTTVLSFPPTITHLALIHITIPIALHRLPQVCPLLVLLDLSYNEWLANPSKETAKSWERVDWGRWGQLKTLGLRESVPTSEEGLDLLARVNKGRWDDIVIIQ
ncbi:hypothetical protein BKA70DRAFT_1247365 [Coprinopsis sp. MPI-PUGE-AT-0042]|nr:hypothetical protein BKA70DRAFT_1247365 [Coprinopsis sp. MPI-PUGE-AT-0042]